jgi:hypothetical protein
MQPIDASFWIGLALAVPLSILGNLATPWFQQLLSRRSEQQAKLQAEKLLHELSDLEELSANPMLLLLDLTRTILILIFLVSGFAALFVSMEWAASAFPTARVFLAVSPSMLIGGGIMIAKFALDAAIQARNVRHLEKHRKVISARLTALGHDAA